MAEDLRTPPPPYLEEASSPESSAPASVARYESEGKRGWLVVLGAFLNFFTGFGFLNAFGTYQDYYKHQNILTVVEGQWISSIQFGLLLASGIFIGPLFDSWGARFLMIPGSVITLVAFLIAAYRTDFPSLVVSLGIMLGVGNAMMFHPAIGAVTGWFDHRRALALGVSIAGASVGGIFWPAITDALLRSFERKSLTKNMDNPNRTTSEPLKLAFIVTLIICLPFMGISCFLVQETQTARHLRDAEELGEKPPRVWSREFRHTVTRCLTKVQWALAVAIFFVWIGAIIPFGFIPMWGREFLVGGSWPNYLLTISYSASVVGRLVLTWISDTAGRFNSVMKDLPTMIVFSILYGFCSGSLMPLGTACISQLSPDLRHTGLRQGMVMFFCSFGIVASGPITGVLFEQYWTSHAMQWFTGGSTVFGGVLLLVTRIWAQPKLGSVF